MHSGHHTFCDNSLRHKASRCLTQGLAERLFNRLLQVGLQI
jgi:hypothetical protein